ncbi:hypothetical protein GQ457_05G027990 [Hibiscus cannabinus]
MITIENSNLGLESEKIIGNLFERKSFAGSESNGNSRVEMSTRDVSHRINQDHDGQSPNYSNPSYLLHERNSETDVGGWRRRIWIAFRFYSQNYSVISLIPSVVSHDC